MRCRVVITGLGTLSSAGANLEANRRNFAAGISCLSAINEPRIAHLRARFAGLLGKFDFASAGLPPELHPHDRHVWMSFVAAREALTGAAVRPAEWRRRLGLVFATCSGPMLRIEQHYERIIRGNPQITAPELFAKRYYAGAQALARVLGIEGYTTTVVTACTASTGAIALGSDLIRCGLLDAVLAGGADAFSTSTLAGFDGLKATSETQCAPFSKPYGLNLGEAASFVFLESAESAERRGVAARAEVLGCGMSNDAFHCSAPEPTGRGLAMAMQRALADAGLAPEHIAYLNAHGTGTEANDKAETRAIRKVFGPQADRLPVSSTKSMVGHCLGAAGAIEVVASILCAEGGVFPPTANFSGPRDGCNLDYLPDPGRPWPSPRTFLSSNLAFGGHNATLALNVPASDLRSRQPGIQGLEPDVRSEEPSEIWITGCGSVSSRGVGIGPLKAGISTWRSFPGLEQIQAGLVDEAIVEKWDRRLDLRHMDRASRWATVACRLALREAAFPEKTDALAELGLYLHLAAGPSWAESEFLTSFLGHDHRVNQLAAFPYIVPSSVAGNVCRALRLTGHNLTLNSGPGAGLLGLGAAVAALRCEHTGALLSVAVDELSERILTDQLTAGLLTGENAIPGEGAAALLLETARHAQARGAKPLAGVCGMAFAVSRPSPVTLAESLRQLIPEALAQARIAPEQVGDICAQGLTPQLCSVLASISSSWPERRVSLAAHTGLLEASQTLVDLAFALTPSPENRAESPFLLALTASVHGPIGAVVFKRMP